MEIAHLLIFDKIYTLEVDAEMRKDLFCATLTIMALFYRLLIVIGIAYNNIWCNVKEEFLFFS